MEPSNETRAATITDSKEQVETLGATTRDSKEPDDAPPLWEVLLLGCVWQSGLLKFKYDHYRQEGGAMRCSWELRRMVLGWCYDHHGKAVLS